MKGCIMQITWIGQKRELANAKHFSSSLTSSQMDLLVKKVIKNATHVGISDRRNGDHQPARILWGDYAGSKYAVVTDGIKLRKNKCEIISFYNINPSTMETKAKRFNMKEVKVH